ncbi:MAG: UTRA domain-containing protein [Egibacteraceae bacterium]
MQRATSRRTGYTDQQLLGIEIVQPPAQVAERLGLTLGGLALVRRNLLSDGGEPAGLVDRYFPLRVAQSTSVEQADRIARAACAECERVVEELTLRMPTPKEGRRLGMSGGMPVVRVLRTCYDASGSVVEVAEFVLAGDRHVLVYEVPAN